MKKTVFALAVSVLGLQACVVAPPQSAVYVSPPPGVVVPPGVVYVAPTYPAPSIDFVWSSTPNMVGGGDTLNAVGIVAGVDLRQPSLTHGAVYRASGLKLKRVWSIRGDSAQQF